MFCAECGVLNPDSAKFCNGCGRKIIVATHPRQADEADIVRGSLASESDGSRSVPAEIIPTGGNRSKIWISALFTIFALVVIGFLVHRPNNIPVTQDKGIPERGAARPTGENDESGAVGFIGKTYVITDREGRDLVSTIESQEVAEQIEDAGRKNDRYGFDQLMSSQQVSSVDSGTKVLVLDLSVWHNWRKARILSGPRYGEIVYLEGSWTKFTLIAD
jgi:hypothetical protein